MRVAAAEPSYSLEPPGVRRAASQALTTVKPRIGEWTEVSLKPDQFPAAMDTLMAVRVVPPCASRHARRQG